MLIKETGDEYKISYWNKSINSILKNEDKNGEENIDLDLEGLENLLAKIKFKVMFN